MRAENDHAFENSIESRKDDAKPHQCRDENSWEDAEHKLPGNGKDSNVCEMFYDTRSDEWDKENDGNTLGCHSCGDANDEENETGNKIRDNHFAENGDSIEKVDPVFYMDKNVTACDLPEIVVCYKEKTYHVVKDICVDEGVPVQEKFLFGEKDSVKCTSNQCSAEALVKVDKVIASPVESKSLEDSNSKVEDSESCNDVKDIRDKTSEGTKGMPVVDVQESSTGVFSEAKDSSNCNQENLIVTEEVKNLENSKEEVASPENVLKESLTLGDILSMEDGQKHVNNNSSGPEQQSQDEEISSETKVLETNLEETDDPKAEKLSSCTTSKESNGTYNPIQDPEKAEDENQKQNYYLADDPYEDEQPFKSSNFPNGFGETSFSEAEPVSVSGHITYSGPISFAGSLSVRSEGSTASGRSFAFPILQSEWNSSPVRMAKADKRNHRRDKGWRHSIFCCRFS